MLFTLSLILISPIGTKSLLYEDLCKQAGGADIARCLSVLKAEPQITSAKNNGELSKLILEFGIKKATEAQNHLKEMMKTNPSQAIAQCATTHYDELVGSFKSSLGELKFDNLTANYDSKVAGDGPTTCDAALAAAKINNPTISAMNSEMELISKIAFLATDKL